jgi:hypothetical protein
MLLMAMLPCGHADVHFNGAHDHVHDAAMELCSVSSEHCECHTCNSGLCSEDLEYEGTRVFSADLIAVPVTPAVLLPWPKSVPVFIKPAAPPQFSANLAALRTIQLLI